MSLHKVCIIGCGNWGSAVSRIIGTNTKRHNYLFDLQVNMWVFEEEVNGRKLSEIINETHENVKYLPGIKLPENIIAVPNLFEAVKDATILVFVLPYQFISQICLNLKGKVSFSAIGVTLIKGVIADENRLELISDMISETLGIPCSVLMGANVANEVANENFCEATVGTRYFSHGQLFKALFETDYFRVTVIPDVAGAEMSGALKDIIANATGFCDGLKYGNNTKAAVIRLGLMEMVRLVQLFYPGTKMHTFLQSCGVADLVSSCYGGRNRRAAQAFIETGNSVDKLEKEMIRGQELLGPRIAAQVNVILKNRKMEQEFPLLTAVHKIWIGEMPPNSLIQCLEQHPEYRWQN